MSTLTSILGGAATGFGFGVVLYKVGATRYSRVMGMLTLRDTKVMKFAFTAIAVASLWYGLAGALGVDESLGLVPRIMPYFGLGHVLGGILFGIAMGVSGLCPGTCIAKVGGGAGDKKGAALAATLGLFAGVLIYTQLKTPLMESGIVLENQKPLTLYGVLGLPYAVVALGLGVMLLGVIFVIDRVTAERTFAPAVERHSLLDYVRGEWSWVASGAIGGTLVVLATAQNGYLGFSGGLLALTGWISHLVGAPLEVVPKITDDILWRAALFLGVLPGGFAAHLFSTPSKAAVQTPLPKTFSPKAIAKSFSMTTLMSLGAMIGGGCTTGAFISAWPTLSIGSFTMAGTFFLVSMVVANGRLLVAHTLDMASAQTVGDRVYD
ncbi:MAG: YeeE/YedE family protein [Deltaproteobacteria bacterium]|nr:YeeE/YedE family protein [Deltaproteobacteria bacterium]